jgi:hypothetical protein
MPRPAGAATIRWMTLAVPDAPPDVDPEEPPDLLLAHLGSTRDGLAGREAERRLSQFGPNVITRAAGASALRRLAAQFTHPLALLLWVAAALALATGSAPLAAAIVVVIVLNAVFAFAQEQQAERATEALAAFLPPSATVLRDGEPVELLATALVPGDVLLLEVVTRRRGRRGVSAPPRLPAGDDDDVRRHHRVPGRDRVRRPHEPGLAAVDRAVLERFLLWGIAFELVFAAAVIWLPPLQSVFGTRGLGPVELALLAPFPFVVWGSDELRRWAVRRHDARRPRPA